MCNCMNKGCSSCTGQEWVHCGNKCFSLGPFRATTSVCPPINTGSIIPFSSGTDVVGLLTDATGTVTGVTAVGFGTAVPGITPAADGTITLPIGTTEAFNVPRTGTITAISGTFTVTGTPTVPAGSTSTITARIYRAPAGSSTFTPTNAFVNLTPTVSDTVAGGTVYQGTASANVPVVPGDRLIMIFSVAGSPSVTLEGTATAGITIS